MRIIITTLAAVGVLLAAGSAQAGSSCSTFAKIKSYDAAKSSITITKESGSESKFFPRVDGAPSASKVPSKCKSKVLSADSFPVKSTGGRLSITQVRSNFEGKMLNDPDDPKWLGTKLQAIAASGEVVVVVVRQPPGGGKDAPYEVTTVYLPITDEELAEIERLNNQGEDE